MKNIVWIVCLLLAFSARVGALEIKVPVKEVEKKISLDPFDRVWKKTKAVELPMMSQTIAPPGGGGAVETVRIKALKTKNEIYFRLDWADATVDDHPSPSENFSDAIALQFPAQPGTWPSPFMGDRENAVVIWRWSASSQKDLDMGYQTTLAHRPRTTADLYAYADDVTFRTGEGAGNILSKRRRQSSVEQLAAKGFGTLTATSDQSVQGKGVWKKGRWFVVFKRDSNGTPNFWTGANLPFASAVWDGNHRERDGIKSVSIWQTLNFNGEDADRAISKENHGRRVFLRYGCAACHGQNGLGGVVNPNAQVSPIPALNRVKEGFSREELRKIIFKGREPERADPAGAPPPFKMNAWGSVMDREEVEALTDYLFSLMPEGEEEW